MSSKVDAKISFVRKLFGTSCKFTAVKSLSSVLEHVPLEQIYLFELFSTIKFFAGVKITCSVLCHMKLQVSLGFKVFFTILE